jgi:insulysin
MTAEEFAQNRTALSVRKAEKPKKLIDRANLIWNEITSEQFNFERQQLELLELEKVVLDDIKSFFEVSNLIFLSVPNPFA